MITFPILEHLSELKCINFLEAVREWECPIIENCSLTIIINAVKQKTHQNYTFEILFVCLL